LGAFLSAVHGSKKTGLDKEMLDENDWFSSF